VWTKVPTDVARIQGLHPRRDTTVIPTEVSGMAPTLPFGSDGDGQRRSKTAIKADWYSENGKPVFAFLLAAGLFGCTFPSQEGSTATADAAPSRGVQFQRFLPVSPPAQAIQYLPWHGFFALDTQTRQLCCTTTVVHKQRRDRLELAALLLFTIS
jgi:hypothetical protein